MKTDELILALEKEQSAVALEAAQRLRELTEWRPMETAPISRDNIIVLDNIALDCHIGNKNSESIFLRDDFEEFHVNELKGWLPLPEGGE